MCQDVLETIPWKIPNQFHGTVTSPVKPLTREHASALRWYLPPWRRGESCGMLRAGDTAPSHQLSPASPREVGWAGLAGLQCWQGG